MGLFKRRERKREGEDSRSYYEVFGDTVVMLNTFKVVTLVLVAIILFQVYVNLKAHDKPPVVIEVNEVGRARAIEDLRLRNEPDEIQMRAFTREFIEAYTAYDSKSVEHDFAKALNLMHSEYQARVRGELLEPDPKTREPSLLSKLKDQNIYARIEIQDIKIEKNTPGWVKVWVAGIRRVHSYLARDFPPKETVFNAYVTLAKVPRTVREPYGLLVYDYQEHIVKDMTPKEALS